MNPFIEIAGREIGYDYEPLIIAEIGINHEGSLQTAKEMVDAAALAGVEIIKHQTHIVEDEMSSAAKKVIPGNADVSIYDIMQHCALSEEEEHELKNYVEGKGIIFISTPFSRAAANRLFKWNVPGYKIGSGECNNYPLVAHIASFGKPVILSTGMNSIESVSKAVNILCKHHVPFALLHTTNLYPTPNHLVRLHAMVELQKAFPNAVIGLSDHTLTDHACFGAVALGASVLERHFTDHKLRTGPDIVCSMDMKECKELIEGCNIIAQQRGGSKIAAKEEQVTIDFAFASICTIQAIKKGEVFTKENIWVKRPGKGGIRAEEYSNILGKVAARDLEEDVQVVYEDIVPLSEGMQRVNVPLSEAVQGEVNVPLSEGVQGEVNVPLSEGVQGEVNVPLSEGVQGEDSEHLFYGIQEVNKNSLWHYNKKLRPFAHELRTSMTKAEACLWKYILRAGMMRGYNFRQQRPILNYIADFMSKELMLIIEVDGISHDDDNALIKDAKRQADLEAAGFAVIRFTDNDVLKEIEGVRRAIENVVDDFEKRMELIQEL